MAYPFKEIEARWQARWEKEEPFKTGTDHSRPKYYVLDMFPYPSGAGLHVGHPEGYTATDIIARYKRMCGFNVLHPMGWDAFGLPAERYAMQTGIHPSITTGQNINNFRRQLKRLGFSYDWTREINTTDPSYYRFTQWIFLQLLNSYYDERKKKARPITELKIPASLSKPGKEADRARFLDSKRLAYIAEMPVNYCAELGTVLANEEVDEWTQKGYTVERRPMRQWMLRITAYAERLLEDLQHVDWPRGTLELQKNWIGRSEGALIDFVIQSKGKKKQSIPIFTTRPDTIYGVTYMVLAPEHPLIATVTTAAQKKAVQAYIEETSRKSDLERQLPGQEAKKTGVFTGAYAIHPLTEESVPIWIADYVLMGYGSGAVMAVPAHDERDFAFAREHSLAIKPVIRPTDLTTDQARAQKLTEAFTAPGINFDSDLIDGMATSEAIEKIIEILQERKLGKRQVNYKLRDWLFSRQRYWGEPVPVSFDDAGFLHAEDESRLPLPLPPCENFQPAASGESPLANLKDWVFFERNGIRYRRETNTMPQWAGSSWYYLRFISPQSDRFVDEKEERYWMSPGGVDLYVGGAEHAVLHLLYARFWHKVLFDLGYVSGPEPFKKLVHQGLILGENGQKMSKSLGNVVNPDDVVDEYGADAFRLFEMFLGPLEQMKPWSSRGIEGVFRFLDRTWRLFTDGQGGIVPELLVEAMDRETELLLHKTIKKVTDDIEKMAFNTAISQLMIFVNHIFSSRTIGRSAAESFVLLLHPFAPHMAEELWQRLGKKNLSQASWPTADENKLQEELVEVVFQINGKVRDRKAVPANITPEELEAVALAAPAMERYLEGKKPRKIIVVPGRLVNFVV
ncbi:MAG: leucine--tRNA ligase [Spirochaetales bacterium]|nr:leucine--tRNA ligase [Spirochaetales bacterium]